MEMSVLAGKQKGHILECNDIFFLPWHRDTIHWPENKVGSLV